MSSQDPQDLDIDVNVVSSPEPSLCGQEDEEIRNDHTNLNPNLHHYNNNLSNTNSFHHSTESRLSPPKTPPEQQCKTSGTSYTSFSISSILSRNEPSKKSIVTPLPTLPQIVSNNNGPQDAAMLSR